MTSPKQLLIGSPWAIVGFPIAAKATTPGTIAHRKISRKEKTAIRFISTQRFTNWLVAGWIGQARDNRGL
jgi:hypothetical protein